MYQEIMTAVVVSIDIFLSSMACCSGGIRIPPLSAAVIGIICASVMAAAVTVSGLVSGMLSENLCETLSCAVLTALGVINITKSLSRSFLRRLAGREELSLHLGGCSIAMRLYLDDTAADLDSSKTLSVPEAAAMALAGSFDCAAAGLSCGGEVSPVTTSLCTLATGITAIFLGTLAGRKISSRLGDLSWAGGIILILFALYNAVTL
ncbi:MAG: manganese efflux pump [Ruminococcus sp.]|nr:manganese efflux pump [Ruminococcus sp.]